MTASGGSIPQADRSPGPLWDDDGSVWLVHPWRGDAQDSTTSSPLRRLTSDGLTPADDEAVTIDGNQLPGCRTLEGPKLYKTASPGRRGGR